MTIKAEEISMLMQKTVVETGVFKEKVKKLKKKAKKISRRLLKRKIKQN